MFYLFRRVGRTRFELVTSSVSGNVVGRSCFRILGLSCGVWSADVHGRMSLSRAVVTYLVTRLRMVSGVATWMQTTGTALLTVTRCSLARVWVPAQDGRSVHGFLYLAAVRLASVGRTTVKHQLTLTCHSAGEGSASRWPSARTRWGDRAPGVPFLFRYYRDINARSANRWMRQLLVLPVQFPAVR